MGAEKQDWKQFSYSYIESHWFDEDRTKTLSAMRTLWERMPQDGIDKLPHRLIIFAPSAEKLGEVFPWVSGNEPGEGSEQESAFIYLSPFLERKGQAEVDSIVAHEFAHVVLGCYRIDYDLHTIPSNTQIERQADIPGERQADALISRWGFESAYKGNRKKHRRVGSKKR
jgi:hypothetical protein